MMTRWMISDIATISQLAHGTDTGTLVATSFILGFLEISTLVEGYVVEIYLCELQDLNAACPLA